MKYFNILTGNLTAVFCLIVWIMGVVLAKGFWLTTLSICLPFYAWYLAIEKVMILTGFLN